MNEMLPYLMSGLAVLFDGNMGWAILTLALAVRLALLPPTLHLARRMRANQKIVQSLQPQVEAIKTRLADKPAEIFPAIAALYKANGARLFDRSTLLGVLVQIPVFGLLYKARKLSAGVGLYWAASALASTVQTGVLRFEQRRNAVGKAW